MAISFDTLAAAEAMESAGLERTQARVIAAQMHAATGASEAVTRPELKAGLARLKTELLERIAEGERALIERITESDRASTERTAESERRVIERTTVLLWRLFGGMVAVFGLAVAAFRYLP